MTDELSISLPEQFDYNYSRELLDLYPSVYSQAKGRQVVLDFSKVQYLDSSALGMLVMLQKKATEQGIAIAIRGTRQEAAEILRMANMQKMINIL
jgi:HptB-dependent secretion and biofilm anti anti-sigma factor